MTKISRVFRLTVAIAVIAGVLSACGGDDAPSQEEFAKNADGVCTDVEQELKSLGKINANSPEELSGLVDQLKSRINEGVERLTKLDRPKGDAGKTAEDFVNTLNNELRTQAIPALDELQQAARERDRVKLRAAGRKLDALSETRSDQLARKLGADECAQG